MNSGNAEGERDVRAASFPSGMRRPSFVDTIIDSFRGIPGSLSLDNANVGLTSEQVLAFIKPELQQFGFAVEERFPGCSKEPVCFDGSDASAEVEFLYVLDAYHPGLRCGLEIADGPWFSDPLHALIVEAEEREFWHAVLVITDEPLRRTWCQPSDTLYVLSCNALGQVAAEELPCGVTVIGLPFMSLRPRPRKHGPAHAVAIRGALDALIRLKEELDEEAGRGNQDAARCASRCIEFVRELLQYVGQHGLE